MTNPAWKKFEQKVAKKLGGRRIPVSGTGSIKGDVITDALLIDCKHGKQIPKTLVSWFEKVKEEAKLEGKIPALVLKPKGKHYELIVIRLDDFEKIR